MKTVSELDRHAELYGFWIVYKRWVPNGWLKLESASPIKSLPQSWSVMLRHSPPKNKEKSVKTVSELDCHAELYGFWIVYKRWVPNGWLKLESASPIKSLPQSWSVMLRHSPPKNKEKSVKTVSELDCHAELYGFWIVYKRWVPNGWLKLESASPIKSLPQSWSVMLRHSPPKNKEKSVKTVSELDCHAEL